MEKNGFDLELFLKSFEMAGAKVKNGAGRILLNGEEIDPYSLLKKELGGFDSLIEAEFTIGNAPVRRESKYYVSDYTIAAA